MLSEVSQYESLASELTQEFSSSPLKNEFLLFWEKWKYLHIKLFVALRIGVGHAIIDEIELGLISKKFFTSRQAMISAFAQGIKNHAEIKNEISLLRNILTKHDSNFMELLKQILSKLLIELNRLQKLRKVTSAYMNSQFSLGG